MASRTSSGWNHKDLSVCLCMMSQRGRSYARPAQLTLGKFLDVQLESISFNLFLFCFSALTSTLQLFTYLKTAIMSSSSLLFPKQNITDALNCSGKFFLLGPLEEQTGRENMYCFCLTFYRSFQVLSYILFLLT